MAKKTMTAAERKRKSDDKQEKTPLWTGTWFTPTLEKRYVVPEDSANYTTLRGKAGVCVGFRQTKFGHVFAQLIFDGMKAPTTVRTTYLKPEEGKREPLREDFDVFPVEEVVSDAILGGYSGTAELRGV